MLQMGLSALQFKHIDSGQNWYRRGEQNLEERIPQVLGLKPDFVEIQTWNDAGESHYFGNSWPEAIAGTAIPAYTDDYDHTGWQQLLPAFIKAYKAGTENLTTLVPTNGEAAQGVFWHHTLTADASCPSDSLGPPSGVENVQDIVTVAVLVAAGTTNLELKVMSGGSQINETQTLVPGYNRFSISGMNLGTQSVGVYESGSSTAVYQGTGTIDVVNTAALCNYNFQVVPLTAA
jgi:glucan endo-1,3-alpha-glucosidase